MISITSEYALRALATLADAGTEATLQAREIASQTSVPASYLSKILTTLRRAGVLGGTRGIGGGYCLARKPEEIALIEVIELFEVVRPNNACLLGRSEGCDDEHPCGAHAAWKKVHGAYQEFLASRTVADLARVEPREDST